VPAPEEVLVAPVPGDDEQAQPNTMTSGTTHRGPMAAGSYTVHQGLGATLLVQPAPPPSSSSARKLVRRPPSMFVA
jgi:hypothetical protein